MLSCVWSRSNGLYSTVTKHSDILCIPTIWSCIYYNLQKWDLPLCSTENYGMFIASLQVVVHLGSSSGADRPRNAHESFSKPRNHMTDQQNNLCCVSADGRRYTSDMRPKIGQMLGVSRRPSAELRPTCGSANLSLKIYEKFLMVSRPTADIYHSSK